MRNHNSILLAFSLLAACAPPDVEAPQPDLPTINEELVSLAARLHGDPSLRPRAAALIEARARLFGRLVVDEPDQALTFALDDDIRHALVAALPDSARSLERHGIWTGSITRRVGDDFARGTVLDEAVLDTGDEQLVLHGPDVPASSMRAADVQGIVLGQDLAIGSVESAPMPLAGSLSCSTHGTQRTVVLLAYPSSMTAPPAGSLDDARAIMFDPASRSVTSYWNETSYGDVDLAGDVFGYYHLDIDFTCDEKAIFAAAVRAADGDVDFTKYTRVVTFVPQPSGCKWSGISTLGCIDNTSADGTFSASHAEVDAALLTSRMDAVRTTAHEVGHSLGLHHARARDFGLQPLGQPGQWGTSGEYGDQLSIMGNITGSGHVAAPHKALIGWLTPTVVTQSGTYRITSLTTAPSALKVKRGTCIADDQLWIELREPVGWDDSFQSWYAYEGVVIHLEDSLDSPIYTNALDFTTMTPGFEDPVLVPGATWTDPYGDLTLRVTSFSGGQADVEVSYAGPPTAVTAGSDLPAYRSGVSSPTLNAAVHTGCNLSAGIDVKFTLTSPTKKISTKTVAADYSGHAAWSPNKITEVGVWTLETSAVINGATATATSQFSVLSATGTGPLAFFTSMGTTSASGVATGRFDTAPTGISCKIDSAPIACNLVGGAGFEVWYVGLAHGPHTVTVTATDANGTRATSASFAVDAAGPVATFASPAATAGADGRVVWAFDEALKSTGEDGCLLDGKPRACVAAGTGYFVTYSGHPVGSQHSFTVYATDVFGNRSASTITWTTSGCLGDRPCGGLQDP